MLTHNAKDLRGERVGRGVVNACICATLVAKALVMQGFSAAMALIVAYFSDIR
jgi:hypothetical protein